MSMFLCLLTLLFITASLFGMERKHFREDIIEAPEKHQRLDQPTPHSIDDEIGLADDQEHTNDPLQKDHWIWSLGDKQAQREFFEIEAESDEAESCVVHSGLWDKNCANSGYAPQCAIISSGTPQEVAHLLAENPTFINERPHILAATIIAWSKKSIKINQDHLEIIRLLIKAGANANGADARHIPLQLAADFGFTEIVKILLDAGTNPDQRNESGSTALMFLAEQGSMTPEHQEIAKLLITKGASVNAQDMTDNTVLSCAARANNIQMTQFLINNKAKIGKRTLMKAACMGSFKCFKLIVHASTKTTLEKQDTLGNTALMLAAREGLVKIVQYLITAGVRLDTQNDDGYTALIHAMNSNNHADLILQFTRRTSAGKITYKAAFPICDRFQVAKLLIDAGANINLRDQSGFTALIHATASGDLKRVRLLIRAGADPLVLDSSGRSLLMLAAETIVDPLIEIESEHNIKMEHLEVLLWLTLKSGIATDLKDRHGKIAANFLESFRIAHPDSYLDFARNLLHPQRDLLCKQINAFKKRNQSPFIQYPGCKISVKAMIKALNYIAKDSMPKEASEYKLFEPFEKGASPAILRQQLRLFAKSFDQITHEIEQKGLKNFLLDEQKEYALK